MATSPIPGDHRHFYNHLLATQLMRIEIVDPSARQEMCGCGPDCDDCAEGYKVRNGSILAAMAVAKLLGYKSGFMADFTYVAGEYVVAYIELPTGQLSWHFPLDKIEWDGHTTEEKYERAARFIRDHT